MNKPRPEFCVGEEVAVRCKSDPSRNTDRTEISRIKFVDSHNHITGELLGMSWCYWTNSCSIPFGDVALRKLPPEDRTQWSDCAWMPKEMVK